MNSEYDVSDLLNKVVKYSRDIDDKSVESRKSIQFKFLILSLEILYDNSIIPADESQIRDIIDKIKQHYNNSEKDLIFAREHVPIKSKIIRNYLQNICDIIMNILEYDNCNNVDVFLLEIYMHKLFIDITTILFKVEKEETKKEQFKDEIETFNTILQNYFTFNIKYSSDPYDYNLLIKERKIYQSEFYRHNYITIIIFFKQIKEMIALKTII